MQKTVTQIGNFSYFPDKIIGQGSTGSVYKGFQNRNKQTVAVKVIKLYEINTLVKKHLLDCEVAALSAIKNRFICPAFDILKDGQFYFIPMEYIPNGTLRDYIKKKGKLSQNEALTMFQRLLQGYCSIQKAGFIHRDLKSQNILLRQNYQPAIIDFGYCQKVQTQNQRLAYNVGSPAYMSPEAYNDSIYSSKSDVWALGIVFHEMLTGTIPIMRTTDVDEYFRYLKNMKTAQIMTGFQNQLCTRLLLHSLAVDTRLRYSAEELLNELRGKTQLQSPMTKHGNPISNYNYAVAQRTQPHFVNNNNTKTNTQSLKNSSSISSFNTPQGKHNNQNHFIQVQRKNSSSSNQWSNESISSPGFNVRKYSTNDSPKLQVRETMPPGFTNLRKRVLDNNKNFNINLTPVRSVQGNEPSPLLTPTYHKQQKNQIIIYNQPFPNQNNDAGKLKKAYSFNNINITPIKHF